MCRSFHKIRSQSVLGLSGRPLLGEERKQSARPESFSVWTQLGHGPVRARETDKFGILWQDRPYSALMPANLITLAHFSMASERIAPNSAGEPPSTVPPSSTIRALILLSARPALSSLFSISIMSAGVFLGAPMPAKPLAS